MKGPTLRQQEVLVAMYDFELEHGYPPSTREMCARFGWVSTNAYGDHLGRMQIKGLVKVSPLKSRGASLTKLGRAIAKGLSTAYRPGMDVSRFFRPVLICSMCGAARVGEGDCPMCGRRVA